MVPNSNAVVNPRTMMIESLYTSITECTVSRAVSSNDFAVRAYTARVEFLYKSLKSKVFKVYIFMQIYLPEI